MEDCSARAVRRLFSWIIKCWWSFTSCFQLTLRPEVFAQSVYFPKLTRARCRRRYTHVSEPAHSPAPSGQRRPRAERLVSPRGRGLFQRGSPMVKLFAGEAHTPWTLKIHSNFKCFHLSERKLCKHHLLLGKQGCHLPHAPWGQSSL